MNNLIRKSLSLNPGLGIITRQVQTNASLIGSDNEVANRNPRNLELMRIARKPVGYYLDKPGKSYWHKLIVKRSNRHLVAEIHHFKNGPVLTVSTEEWALKKQLFRTSDIAAYKNVGRLLAQRALESGITAVSSNIDTAGSQKLASFVDAMKEGGLQLEEPPRYRHANAWDRFRDVKPWTVPD